MEEDPNFSEMDNREIPDEDTVEGTTIATIVRLFDFQERQGVNFGRAYLLE